MFNNNNIAKLACRVCFSTDGNKVIMNSENGWLHLFDFCIGLQISLRDEARTLCEPCTQSLKEFAGFKNKCLKSDNLWKSNIFPQQDENQKIIKTEHTVLADTENDNESNEIKEEMYYNIYDEFFDDSVHNSKIDVYCQGQFTNIPISIDKSVTVEKVAPTENKNETTIDSIRNRKKSASFVQKANSSKDDLTYTNDDLTHTNDDLTHSNDDCTHTNDDLTHTSDAIDSNDDNCSITKKISDSNENKNPCKCGNEYSCAAMFTKHIKKCDTYKFYQSQIGVLQSCGLCKFSTQDVNDLKKHLGDHFQRNDLECKLCDYTGRDFAEMAYHRYTHFPGKSRLNCFKCHSRFLAPKSLQFHFRIVHLMKKKGGLCTFCGIQLSNLNTWKKHELRKHSNILEDNKRVFICDCCGLKFACRYEIIEHLRMRSGIHKYVCDTCGDRFNRPFNLRCHIRNMHNKTETTKCPECNKTIKSYVLKKHIATMHGEQKYVCEICSKKFRVKFDLDYHIMSHTNERPYKCNLCGTGYKTNNHLKVHMFTHTGVKPNVCNVCQKSFLTMKQLQKHASSHNNVRATKCEKCDKSFHYQKVLEKHIARAHSGIES